MLGILFAIRIAEGKRRQEGIFKLGICAIMGVEMQAMDKRMGRLDACLRRCALL